MKTSQLVILLSTVLLLVGCQPNKPYVEIIAEKDTVHVNEMYVAKIYLRNYENWDEFPLYYILSGNNDIVYLDIDTDERCGVFRATHAKPNNWKFEGFIVYRENDTYDTIDYSKEYFIIDGK